MLRYIVFLVLASFSSLAQAQAFRQFTLSLGYGYYDIRQQMVRHDIENFDGGFYYNFLYNVQSELTGPIYVKTETNLSKDIGLALCFGYDDFTFTGNYDAYLVRVAENGTEAHAYTVRPSPDEEIVAHAKRTESLGEKSWSISLRTNFYLINKTRFQLYMGLGIGYRNYTFTHKVTEAPNMPNDHFLMVMTSDWTNPIAGEVTLGCRGFIWKNIGIYTEIGLAKSLFQVGICTRLERK